MGIEGYLKLEIKTIRQFPNGEIEFSFHDFNVSIKLLPKDIKRFGLQKIYPRDFIFIRGKRGNKEENFIEENPIEDIKIKHSVAWKSSAYFLFKKINKVKK